MCACQLTRHIVTVSVEAKALNRNVFRQRDRGGGSPIPSVPFLPSVLSSLSPAPGSDPQIQLRQLGRMSWSVATRHVPGTLQYIKSCLRLSPGHKHILLYLEHRERVWRRQMSSCFCLTKSKDTTKMCTLLYVAVLPVEFHVIISYILFWSKRWFRPRPTQLPSLRDR